MYADVQTVATRWQRRPGDRARRDLVLMAEIERVFETNYSVYGARKVWRQLRREGRDVARCTVERLIRDLGLAGAIRGKPAKTTISDKGAACPLDKVNRQFPATTTTVPGGRVTTKAMWRGWSAMPGGTS